MSTFPEACSELTKWCQDQRAFTAHFEDNLMMALEVHFQIKLNMANVKFSGGNGLWDQGKLRLYAYSWPSWSLFHTPEASIKASSQ